jgi:hypothetical protein
MARRRSMDGADEYEGGGFNLGGGAPGLGGKPAGGGRVDEFGNEVPDFSNDPNFPTPFADYTPDEIAGDSTTARELGNHKTPNLPLAQPGPHETGLPTSMTVQSNEGYGSDFGGDQASYSTPMQGFSPNPVSGQHASPEVTQRVSSPGAQSALFSDASGGTPMFGRAGGLMGGGKGVLGSNEGQPTPTEMMLKLVRMYQNGGM